MSHDPASDHRAAGPARARVAILTVSDTRDLATDKSGRLIQDLVEAGGHHVSERLLVKDEADEICATLLRLLQRADVDVALVTGGTGIASRDVTVDVVAEMIHKELTGFGELFRMLSFNEIGAAAMLSRAIAGTVDDKLVFVMPGSSAAVKLAMERLILPELVHSVGLLRQ